MLSNATRRKRQVAAAKPRIPGRAVRQRTQNERSILALRVGVWCGYRTLCRLRWAFHGRIRAGINRFTPRDGVEDLASMNRNFLRGLDTKADLVSTNFNDDDRDIVVDDDAFVFFSR